MRMFCSSFARCSWLPCASALLLGFSSLRAAEAAAPRVAGNDVEKAWFHVGEQVNPLNAPGLVERCDELLRVSHELGLARLTPFALALVAQARTLPPSQAYAVLNQAVRLDPRSPEARFALAEVSMRRGAVPAAASSLARGTIDLFTDDRLTRQVWASVLIAALAGGLVGVAVWGFVAARRVFPRLWHDLSELGAHLKMGSNSPIIALVIVVLPAFAGGDPVWIGLWIFALCWAYLSGWDKLIGLLAMTLVVLTPTLFEAGFRTLAYPPNALRRATTLIQENRYDPLLVHEVSTLRDVFAEDPEFFRLQGDLYRQLGLLDAAALSYREGLRVAPANASLSLALGWVRYHEGDYNAALQAFQTARDSGADRVAVNYDLALALAQTYHFRESDEAMALARDADAVRLRNLTRGRDQQVILPPLSEADADALLARKDPVLLLNRGILPPPLVPQRTLLNPLSLAGLIALLVSIAHFLAREHTTGFAGACLKCGRAFCKRCKLAQESQSYCSQCVNIFLKKDMVAIDTQLAKRKQLARRQTLLHVERRVLDLVIPGLGLWRAGRSLIGISFAVAAGTLATAAIFWLPTFIGPLLLHVNVRPMQVLCVGLWVLLAAAAQTLATERR